MNRQTCLVFKTLKQLIHFNKLPNKKKKKEISLKEEKVVNLFEIETFCFVKLSTTQVVQLIIKKHVTATIVLNLMNTFIEGFV